MKELLKQVYGVMYKYQKYFTERGVMANLEQWQANKGPLVDLLRRHPQWDEDELALIFPVVESRGIDSDTISSARHQMLMLARECRLNSERLNNFTDALNAATNDCSKTPSKESIDEINQKSAIKCVVGQKASRIIGKLCCEYGVDQHQRYQSVYAQLSDALNPVEQRVKVVLSVHPCDFLEMSNRDNSWTSCHGLEDGGYQSGCLSYMNDGVSMILFTVDEDVDEVYHKAPKRNRQIFCYHEGKLLQSRLYPKDGLQDVKRQYRLLVQGVLALCMDVPDRWVLKKKRSDFSGFLQSAIGSKQYPDYDSYGNISFLKYDSSDEPILIGERPHCVCCGDSHTSSGSIKCGCTDFVVCYECGETARATNALYIDGVWLCKSCSHICAVCDEVKGRGELLTAFDGHGHIIQICPDCHAGYCQHRDLHCK